MQCSCVRACGREWLLYPFSTLSRHSLPGWWPGTAIVLSICGLLLLARDWLGRSLARASVGMGALTTNWKAAPVPQPSIATEVHQPLDVHGNLTAEVTL